MTIMDATPRPGLPMYQHDARCGVCQRREIHRIEADHPSRGRILVCGACAFVLGAMRDPLAPREEP